MTPIGLVSQFLSFKLMILGELTSGVDIRGQIHRMAVVTGNLTRLNNDFVLVAIPGCSVIKTWRVKNEAEIKWPKDVFLKSVSNDLDCELPTIARSLSPEEEMEISIRFDIPDKAENKTVLQYVFHILSKEFGQMGQLHATVQVDKELFQKKIDERMDSDKNKSKVAVSGMYQIQFFLKFSL